jgi:TolA-binding protein
MSYRFLSIHRVISCMIAIALLALFVPSSVVADDREDAEKGKALDEIGVAFDAALLRAPGERSAAIGNVAASLDSLTHEGLPSNKRSAAAFLAGQLQYVLGEYDKAIEYFHEARKKDESSLFQDDARFSEILAMEALGRDDDAAKEWKKWEKDFSGSPLMPEALLAQTWNAMRRDSLGEAQAHLARLKATTVPARAQRSALLAEATLDYAQGDADAASKLLKGDKTQDLPGAYLAAMCLETDGEMLKAAAQYQQVVERYGDSALHDYAMFAKANIFLKSAAYRSAAEEFIRVTEKAHRKDVIAEADLRAAACTFLDGDVAGGTARLRVTAERYFGTDVAARAQMLLGEVLISQERYEDAILELNRVLTNYFNNDVAPIAQYRVGRCLDALGRGKEATSSYQLVVSGYPQAPQSPAAAYLAGVGLLEQNLPQAAAPYFQLVLDRYARESGEGTIVFASPEHQELVEASLCLLELSYHRAGNLGQLSGVPHMMLKKMPPSSSQWRAYALLIDADALAAQARFDEAQNMLATLLKEFPSHEIGVPANRLLAWTYARQGKDKLAIQTEEKMLANYASDSDTKSLASAYLNKAHILFNRKEYKKAAATYDDFLRRFPNDDQRLLALYQSGLCHLRLDNTGNAVDRWEEVVATAPSDEIAEKAWTRAGDLYFRTEHYEEAKRCYHGLLDNFADSRAAALGMLRIAQCDYNAGRDSEALDEFAAVTERFPGTGIASEAERGIERALYRLGQRADGPDVLAELVERYPTSAFAADAQFEIAMRHYDAGQFVEAAEAFRRVTSQFPSYSAGDRATFLMADALEKSGSPDQAKLAYEQFLKFFPESELAATVRFRVGSMHFDDEEYMQAAVEFGAVLEGETTPEVAAASKFNLALCRRMLGDNDAAQQLLKEYRKAHGRDERAGYVAYYLGDIAEKKGDLKGAEEEYKTAVNREIDDDTKIEVFYRLGTVREQLADDDGAIRAYRYAIRSKKKGDAFRLSAVARCAALYEKKGDFKRALSAYRDLIANADDPELVLAAKERASELEASAR